MNTDDTSWQNSNGGMLFKKFTMPLLYRTPPVVYALRMENVSIVVMNIKLVIKDSEQFSLPASLLPISNQLLFINSVGSYRSGTLA